MSKVKFFNVLPEIQREASRVVPRIAEKIAGRAKEIVVVDSGELRDSIEATADSVKATADHASAVELGTAKRAAQPFMRPAIEQFNKTDLEQCIR